jgi:predicted RNA methylase
VRKSPAETRLIPNETVAAIESGDIDAEAIARHIGLAAGADEPFRPDPSHKIGGKPAAVPRSGRDVDHVAIGVGRSINQAFRSIHAVNLVETMLGMVALLWHEEGPVRWIDIGCGTGRFANGVNPRRFGAEKWEIVGCDSEEGKIALANRRCARARSFFCSDAFTVFEDYQKRGEPFHLVSLFAFLERLDDPLRFVRRLKSFDPSFVLALSPLARQIGSPHDIGPTPAHLWSFTRRAWEQMFALAGFEVVYSAEVRVGSYIGGQDWLTVICRPKAGWLSRCYAALPWVEDANQLVDTPAGPASGKRTVAATRRKTIGFARWRKNYRWPRRGRLNFYR